MSLENLMKAVIKAATDEFEEGEHFCHECQKFISKKEAYTKVDVSVCCPDCGEALSRSVKQNLREGK
jgi:predicted RNA-binding Zn-ribbon protein involved in translation (DUF1610 family)